jgi:glutamate/tyrosine decarboxylase-like PLP-dependent enzyme
MPMNPSEASWSVLVDVAERAQRYLNAISERPVVPGRDALERLNEFDVPLQDESLSAGAVVDELDRIGSPATVGIAGPRYFGFVNGGALPSALAANWMSTAWEQHGGFQVSSPGSSRLERIAIRWIVELLGLPSECAGAFVTGTTAAHVSALAAARDALLAQSGWNSVANGLFGAPQVTVIAGDEAHSTLFKALGVIGLGRARVVRIPVDSQGRMIAASIPPLTGPTIVCVQAGNVNTGSFDPCREIVTRVRANDVPVWIHVDGAFGLWARVAPERAHLAEGIELADSWATDAHKWLNSPYDCGIVLVRDGNALRKSMAINADYLPSDQSNPSDYTPEVSRRPRGVDAWAALRGLGRSGLSDLVERCCRLAKRFADAFEAAGFEILNDVVLNQVLVSFGDAERTRRVIADIQADGTCWCGATVWQGKTAMRVSVISWATTEADVDRSIEAILRIARS